MDKYRRRLLVYIRASRLINMKLIVLYLFFMLTSAYSRNCTEHRVKELETRQIGKYIPQCNDTIPELYMTTQCWGGVGTCWCANATSGEKISENFNVFEMIQGRFEPPCE